jgi:hypothetical protein
MKLLAGILVVACLFVSGHLSLRAAEADPCGFLQFQEADMWATSPRMRSVSWDGRQFLAPVSTTLFTSPDGLTWTAHDTGCGEDVEGPVVSDGHVWLAQCFYGLVRSTDGVTFSPVGFPNPGCVPMLSRQGDFFFAGCSGALFASADGLRWTPLPLLGVAADTVAFGKGLYVIAGTDLKLYLSPDLAHWRQGYFPAEVSHVLFENGTFLAYGGTSGAVLASSDGQYWQQADVPPPHLVAHGGGRFVNLADAQVYTSTDGIHWTGAPYKGFFKYPYMMAFGNGRFVAPTEQGLLTTSDGSSWEALWPWAVSYQYPFSSPRFLQDAGRFVAVVGYSTADGGPWTLRLSEDGVAWSEYPIQPLPPNTGLAKNAAANAGGRWVVVGGQNQAAFWASSADLITWSSGTLQDLPPLADVAYGDGRYVAVSQRGPIVASTDGTDWSVVPDTDGYGATKIWFGHGKFFALGWSTWLESDDGITWRAFSLQNGGHTDFSLGPLGFSMLDSYGNMYLSYDGEAWLQLDPQIHFYSAFYPWRGRYIAAGGTVPGIPNTGTTFILTDDFVNWSPLQSNLRFPPQSLTSNGDTLVVDDSAFSSECYGPAIHWIAPFEGPSQGGNLVAVTGSGLSACDQVYLGETPAPSFSVISDTELSVEMPPRAGVDLVSVSATAPGMHRQYGWFVSYDYQANPVVTDWAPKVLSSAGHQQVAVSGRGLGMNPAIGLGSDVLPLVSQALLEGGVTGVTQPMPAGTYDLIVQADEARSTTYPGVLIYADPPEMTGASLNITTGQLTVVGTGFDPGCTVQLDGLVLQLKKYKSSTKVIATYTKLAKLLARGKTHAISVLNPNGLVTAPFLYTR